MANEKEVRQARMIRNRSFGFQMMEQSHLMPPKQFTRIRGRGEGAAQTRTTLPKQSSGNNRILFNRSMGIELHDEARKAPQAWDWVCEYAEKAADYGEEEDVGEGPRSSFHPPSSSVPSFLLCSQATCLALNTDWRSDTSFGGDTLDDSLTLFACDLNTGIDRPGLVPESCDVLPGTQVSVTANKDS